MEELGMSAASGSATQSMDRNASENTEALVLRQDKDAVAYLTLNRPRAYNALSTSLMSALQDHLDALARDHNVQAVVIAGAGKGFCAGHDLKELRGNRSRDFYEQVFAQCSKLMLSIVHLPKPVIARVHGIATAAGCQLVASCDLAVAAEGTEFGTPGINIGLFCSTPMVALSRNVPRKVAMEMLLTGDRIVADEAVSFGLINKAVPDERLDEETAAIARKIVAKSPYVLKIGKEAFYRQLERSLEDAYAYTSEVMVTNMMARDAAEGIDAFIEKRDPVWSGE
jgi:enoyl-CoA hydratase/carnithine racemase